MRWLNTLGGTWKTLPPQQRRLTLGVLGLAIGLLVLSFILPAEHQMWAVVGLFVLFVAVQGTILGQMVRQRPAVRKAQRLFRAGDFAGVVRLLETEDLKGKADALGNTLLGNAYRQLGRLEDSQRALENACADAPDAPYAAYGLGRTLLVMGHFAEAAEQIARAVELRGLPVIQSELALAHHYAEDDEAAAAALHQVANLAMEPHRMLMSAYLRGRIDAADEEHTRQRLARHSAGLAFWRAEAEMFAETPYGAALAGDVAAIEAEIGEAAGDEPA